MLDVVLVREMTPQMRGHFCISQEFLIFAFDILAEVGVVRGVALFLLPFYAYSL